MTDKRDLEKVEVEFDEEQYARLEQEADALGVSLEVLCSAYSEWALRRLEQSVEEGDEETAEAILGDILDEDEDVDLERLAEVFDRV